MKKQYLLLLLLSFSALTAQEKVVQGSFKNLADIKLYNVVFDYEGQNVDFFASEEAFLKDKMDKRKGEKAEDFRKKWFADRESNYEPSFIAYFNKHMDNRGVTVAKNPEALYTILIKTTWIYPGYNVFVVSQTAKISAVITVYEKANPKNILLKVTYDKSKGILPDDKKNSYDFGDRISGAYIKLAKNLTLQLKRFVKNSK